MQTSSYHGYREKGGIGITVGTCRFRKGVPYYRALAPRRDMLRLPQEQYAQQFLRILKRLDPDDVWRYLHLLVHPHEPVLLCFEQPPFSRDNWCHRRLVAEWFEETTGHVVPEVGYGPVPFMQKDVLPPPPKQRNLFGE